MDTNEEKEKSEISLEVVQTIREGNVRMRPQWQFWLKHLLLFSGSLIFLLAALYLASFIIFSLRETGLWFAPGFGSRGWLALLKFFPWLLIGLSLVFILTLELLVRKFSFAYRQPLLFSLLIILLSVTVAAFIVADWHRPLFLSPSVRQLPLAGDFYRNGGGERPDGLRRGRVIQIGEGQYIIENSRGVTTTVLIEPDTELLGGALIGNGDMIVIFGSEEESRIKAYMIRPLGPVGF